MAIDVLQTLEVIEVMENFLTRKRPPEDIRHKLDLGYKIEDQSIYVFSIRPDWKDPKIIREHPIAKTTYIRAKKSWKVFWLRGNLKWHSYTPYPAVKKLETFTKLVEEDQHCCFFG